MIVRIDRAWLLDLAHRHLPGDPDVSDFGTLAAAAARHVDSVMDTPVYTEAHHRAAALMVQLIRCPALVHSNELFGAVVAASYMSVSGVIVDVQPKQAAALAARISRDALDVRSVAAEIKGWATR
ncbi:fic family toxin-antitoxin system, toxin component [Streptomyces griseoluteus]|uniref:Fic family toxin-antitoxin system, toxin component n=1 Tax=Streptomyces griseoluteus TaxID=29306 RepID=A0A4Z1CZK9_STRGP|nr:fic family toxin-antitoxin system, toxin component [Streptomyces griseoluteus]TGN74355.1 fic family toxin-antitoxin system, toxin component [Streptomyces griseoluteus]